MKKISQYDAAVLRKNSVLEKKHPLGQKTAVTKKGEHVKYIMTNMLGKKTPIPVKRIWKELMKGSDEQQRQENMEEASKEVKKDDSSS